MVRDRQHREAPGPVSVFGREGLQPTLHSAESHAALGEPHAEQVEAADLLVNQTALKIGIVGISAPAADGRLRFDLDGARGSATVVRAGSELTVFSAFGRHRLVVQDPLHAAIPEDVVGRISSSSAASAASRSYSCRTSRASSSAASTRRAASPSS
jgi:hypothetical protein